MLFDKFPSSFGSIWMSCLHICEGNVLIFKSIYMYIEIIQEFIISVCAFMFNQEFIISVCAFMFNQEFIISVCAFMFN